MSENIIIAIIGTVGVFATIIGSIIAVQLTNNFNEKQQRILDMRKIKLEYYHRFIEAFAKKYNYCACADSVEGVEANLNFILEVNRLPLYASQEMVDLIENIRANGGSSNFSELYTVLRKDLSTDEFLTFANLNFSFTIPEKTVIADERGNKKVV